MQINSVSSSLCMWKFSSKVQIFHLYIWFLFLIIYKSHQISKHHTIVKNQQTCSIRRSKWQDNEGLSNNAIKAPAKWSTLRKGKCRRKPSGRQLPAPHLGCEDALCRCRRRRRARASSTSTTNIGVAFAATPARHSADGSSPLTRRSRWARASAHRGVDRRRSAPGFLAALSGLRRQQEHHRAVCALLKRCPSFAADTGGRLNQLLR